MRNHALRRETYPTTTASKSIQSTRCPFTKGTSTDAQMAIGMPMIRPQITRKYCIDSAPRLAAGPPRRRLFQFLNNAKAANNTRPAWSTQNQTASESISQRFMFTSGNKKQILARHRRTTLDALSVPLSVGGF